MASKQEQLQALIAPVVEALECELWGLDYLTRGRSTTLRLYIEHAGGVTLEHCEKVSRQVSSMLDVEDPISGEYTLEVSSPGMDRPLFTLAQFGQYVGETVALRLRVPVAGRRKMKGTLQSVGANDVQLVVDNETYTLPYETIERANIVPRF